MEILIVVAVVVFALMFMNVVPVALTAVEDIPLADSVQDILANIPGGQLAEESLVIIALNGETVDIRAQISIGTNQILPESRVTVNATIGVLPITPDDVIVASFGTKGDQITIRGSNQDVAAARELRAKVMIFPTSDIELLSQALRGLGIPVSA